MIATASFELYPYIAGFFLVFAGLLIGYFLWYRNAAIEEAARRKLSLENEDLRTSLKLAHGSHEQLDERFTRQKGQLNVLQQLCDDWSASREQGERERAQLEVDAADKARKFEEAMEELRKEKNVRIELEDSIHKITQAEIVSKAEIEDEWRNRHAEVESQLLQHQAESKTANSENERLTKQLHAAEAAIAELTADLDNQVSLLNAATANHSGLKQEYISIESSLQVSADQLKNANSKAAAALSAQRVAEDSMAELQISYEDAQRTIEQLRGKLSGMKSLESQVVSLQESLKNNTTQLEKVSFQRDQSLEAEKSSLNRASGMQKRIDNQEATIHKLREKRELELQRFQEEIQKRAEAEIALKQKQTSLETQLKRQTAQLESQTSQLQQQTGDLSSTLEKERSQWQSKLAAKAQEISQISVNRDELESELAMTKNSLSKSQQQLEQAKQERSQWESRLTTKSHELSQVTMTRDEIESELAMTKKSLSKSHEELARAKGEVENLLEQVRELKITCQRIVELERLVKQRDGEDNLATEELRTLRNQYADAYAKQQQLMTELTALRNERNSIRTDHSQYIEQVELLQGRLEASEATIRALRNERAAVLAQLANYRAIAEPDATVISFTEAMAQRRQQEVVYDQEYGGHTSQHEVRGTVYTEAPETKDDLKRISGIAEVLEARLNDYGIYTFKQIMEWKPKAIEEFSRLLTFKDRIERDDWLSQARFFYNEKTKRSAVA